METNHNYPNESKLYSMENRRNALSDMFRRYRYYHYAYFAKIAVSEKDLIKLAKFLVTYSRAKLDMEIKEEVNNLGLDLWGDA